MNQKDMRSKGINTLIWIRFLRFNADFIKQISSHIILNTPSREFK